MKRVLIVDDQQDLLDIFSAVLAEEYLVDTALSGGLALEKMEGACNYTVIISDMAMPGMNGAELLAKVREKWPDTVRIMLTGAHDQRAAVSAVNEGRIFRFITKPSSVETLLATVADAVRQHELIAAEKKLRNQT